MPLTANQTTKYNPRPLAGPGSISDWPELTADAKEATRQRLRKMTMAEYDKAFETGEEAWKHANELNARQHQAELHVLVNATFHISKGDLDAPLTSARAGSPCGIKSEILNPGGEGGIRTP